MPEMTKEQALMTACELAQKFGFVSRKIIWKHLTYEGRSTRFKYWRFLQDAPQLAPYKAGVVFEHHLVLSPEYRKSLEGSAVSTRSAIYFEHDDYLMDLILHLKASGAIVEYWSELELKADRLLAIQTLGGDPDKVPDLVFDLFTDRGPLRVALEIERTRKSQKRYRLAHMGHSRLRRIDLLLFGVVDRPTEMAIAGEFEQAVRGSSALSVGYFSLNDFDESGLNAELRIRGKRPQIGEFLRRVCGERWKLPSAAGRQIVDKVHTTVFDKAASTAESK